MKRIIEPVAVNLIDLKEKKYQFSLPVPLKPLVRSIEQIGLIHPVVLNRDQQTGRYRVICGYKRVLASLKLGRQEVDAQAILLPVDPIELLYMNINDTLSQRELHFLEAGSILRKLKETFHCSREDLVHTHMPLLGADPSGFTLDRLVSLAALEAGAQRFIVENRIPLHVSEHFLRFTAAERGLFVRIFRKLHFGTNKVKEFLTYVKEISIRDGISPIDTIDRLKINDILRNNELSTAEAGALIRNLLHKNKFPVTEKLEREFHDNVKLLDLPQNVSLSHAKNFEDSRLKVVLQLKRPEDLEVLSETLSELGKNKQFLNLFSLA